MGNKKDSSNEIKDKEKVKNEGSKETKKQQEIESKKVVDAKNNNKNKKRNIILIISGVVLFIILAIISLIINRQSDTHVLATKIKSEYSNLFNLNGTESIYIFDQEEDETYKYSYVNASLIYISTEEKDNVNDIVPEVIIAKYNSDLEATEKVNFFENYYKRLHEKLDDTFYMFFDNVKEEFSDEDNYVFTINNYVININKKYKDNYSDIKKYLTDNIEKSNPKSIPSKEEITKYWNEVIDVSLKVYDDNRDVNVQKIKDYLKDYVDNFDDCTIDECKKYYDDVIILDKFEDFKEDLQIIKNKYNEVVIKVIDFKNVSYNDARAWCTNNNLKSCYISKEYSDTIPNGGLILQSVQPDEIIKRDSKISAVYSKGKEPSLEYKNALRKAQSYLNAMAFSYQRLIEQLEYEGFSHDASVYAVDNCGADWNEQAYKKAQSYLNAMAFSRQRLIEQLIYEKFTREQAEYGVNKVGL